jgi:hypothetical protein
VRVEAALLLLLDISLDGNVEMLNGPCAGKNGEQAAPKYLQGTAHLRLSDEVDALLRSRAHRVESRVRVGAGSSEAREGEPDPGTLDHGD